MKKPDIGMLGNIKDKLGFANKHEDYDGYDELDDTFNEGSDEYAADDYNDYGEYSYDGDYGNSYSPSAYDNPTHVPLVSLDEVRARTQVPESLTRDPLAPHTSTSTHGYATQGSAFNPIRPSVPEDDGYSRPPSGNVHREDAVVPAGSSEYFSSEEVITPPDPVGYGADKPQDFDPYEAYAGAGYTPTRGLNVIKPVAYREVERIAKALKGGDAVILCFRNTPDPLMKRILDFSFGVSSALDASVECVADKVFVVVRGAALSEQEKMQLRDQGVL